MDPTENVEFLARWAREHIDDGQETGEVANHIEALICWMSNGGAPPNWKEGRYELEKI